MLIGIYTVLLLIHNFGRHSLTLEYFYIAYWCLLLADGHPSEDHLQVVA